MEQVEKPNQKPFKLKAFGKDSIAIVSDWDGRALAALAGDCNAGVSLRADPKASAGAISFQPTRNTVPPTQQFARQDRQLARF